MSSWTSFQVPFTVVCFDPTPLFENSDNTVTHNDIYYSFVLSIFIYVFVYFILQFSISIE